MSVIWITGAKGFIGMHLSRYLGANGHKVYGIGHGLWSRHEREEWVVSGWVNGEIDSENLSQLYGLSGTPEKIYHLAGGSSVGASIANPLEDFSRTVDSTANLLEWLHANAPEVDLVAVSSAAVYGSVFSRPINESDQVCPCSPYGHHKLMMETLCRRYAESYGLKCIIVRLFSVYGPWLRKQLLWDLCDKLAARSSVIRLGGTGAEARDWTYIRDVVRFLSRVVEYSQTEFSVINGGSGIATTVSDIAQMVVNAWGGEANIEFSGEKREGDPFCLVSSGPVFKDHVFEWKIPVAQGITNYVEWYRKNYQ